jgi:hypothetical protein
MKNIFFSILCLSSVYSSIHPMFQKKDPLSPWSFIKDKKHCITHCGSIAYALHGTGVFSTGFECTDMCKMYQTHTDLTPLKASLENKPQNSTNRPLL